MNAKGQTWNEHVLTVTRPKKRARVKNLVKWDCGWWHKYRLQSK